MSDSKKSPSMPEIIVSAADSERLHKLATASMRCLPELAGQLMTEIDRAEVSSASQALSKVAQMGSTVEFRRADG